MKLAYQVAMPELEKSLSVTAFQGDLDRGFALLKDNGYSGAELMMRNPSKENMTLIDSLCEKYDLKISMFCTGEIWAQDHISLSDKDDESRGVCINKIKSMIDFASHYGAQVNIGRVRGNLPPDLSDDGTFVRAIRSFTELADYAYPRNVIIALEPVNRLQCNFINSTAEGREVVDSVNNPSFKMMLDLFHMNIEDKNICEEISNSRNYFSYVHVTDNNRLYPGNCGFDFGKIISALKDSGYDGWLSVEVFQLPSSEVAIEGSAECLSRFL